MQVFLAVLVRDYEWECDPTEKWVTAENRRYAGATTQSELLFDWQRSMRKKACQAPFTLELMVHFCCSIARSTCPCGVSCIADCCYGCQHHSVDIHNTVVIGGIKARGQLGCYILSVTQSHCSCVWLTSERWVPCYAGHSISL